jgi:hypothetical protein
VILLAGVSQFLPVMVPAAVLWLYEQAAVAQPQYSVAGPTVRHLVLSHSSLLKARPLA